MMRKRNVSFICGQTRDDDALFTIEGQEKDFDDVSRYSLTGEILPSLGATARSNLRIKLRRFIISPFDPRYRVWEIFLVFLVFYTAWASPFEFGFLEKPLGPLAIIDNVVNAFFAVDIVMTFFLAYLDKNTYLLIDNRKQIAMKYAKTWLIFDVVSIIPSELIRYMLPQRLQPYGYFSMLRLWRLRRVSRFFARLEKDRNYSYFWVRCLKLICVTLFVINVAGCFFYRLGVANVDTKKSWIGLVWEDYHKEPLSVRYVTSLYWSITTLTTTGYGDLHAVTEKEMIFVMIYMMIDLGLTSYLIGNMTNLVVHATSRTRQFRDTIQAASSFGQRNHLPVRLQDQMLAHLSLKYRTDSEGLHQQETIDSLPKAIRSSIASYLFYSLVDKVYLFRGVSNDLLFQLVTEMKAEYFPPREDVILENEAPTDMYILVTGALELTVKRNGVEQVVGEAKTGDVVGETGLVCYRPQLFTARTKRLSQLLRLNRTAFLNILQANVGDGTMIVNNLLQHLKESKDPMTQRILGEIELMLARGRMDLPLTLYFAAMRGDDLLLLQLLKRGLDPNELDNNGRTALHIAALNGSEHCVILLLEYGANPNKQDSEGIVPLWEALQGKHDTVVKLLVDNGANISYGDVGQYALRAIEQNDLDLLKKLVGCGGNVTLIANSGTLPLHAAISEGNTEIVKFLLDVGADVDLPDVHGWTARDLADQQGHEEIQSLVREIKKTAATVPTMHRQQSSGGGGASHVGKPIAKYSSEPTIPSIAGFDTPSLRIRTPTTADSRQRRRVDNFQNSLFGIMSAATTTSVENEVQPSPTPRAAAGLPVPSYQSRVTISCPGHGSVDGKLVQLPNSLQELLELGFIKFGFQPTKVLLKEGAEIEDIELIRDGDYLLLV
ncbi:potassium channel AKT6-like [Euphorbia lathyris]|uniref:potassium channel AKT6-like n=1 Tax=Euphorbia lathyris TaxID=212925 RepID=UPI003313BCF7